MSIDIERRISDTPPTPEQLHKLAAIGVSSAVAREKLRMHPSQLNARFVSDELDLDTDTACDNEDLPSRARHRLTMRFGARLSEEGERIRSLKYASTYSVEFAPEFWVAERATHRFEWTRQKVLLAERAIIITGLGEPQVETLADVFDNFKLRDDSVDILHASDQFQEITADDCEELIADMDEYFRALMVQ